MNSKGKLVIYKIRLENFKSYYGVHEIGPFHKCFSAVIGANGSGKSNLIDSMVFIFGKRASWMRLKHLRELIHNSAKFGKCDKASVTVEFMEINKDFKYIEGTGFSITRSITQRNESTYIINEEKSSQKAVIELLKSNGVDLDNNRFMILQGEVEQISLMKPKTGNSDNPGYLEYLEDIIGTAHFMNEIEEKQEVYEKKQSEKEVLADLFRVADEEMKKLSKHKNDTLEFIRKEKEVFQYRNLLLQCKKQDYIDQIDKLTEEKEKMKIDKHRISEELKDEMVKNREEFKIRHDLGNEKKSLEREMEEENEKMKEHEEAYNQKQVELKRLGVERKELEKEQTDIDNKVQRIKNNEKEVLNEIGAGKHQLEQIKKEKHSINLPLIEMEKVYGDELKHINTERLSVEKILYNLNEQIKEKKGHISHDEDKKEELEKNLEENKELEEKYRAEIIEKKKEIENIDSSLKGLADTKNKIKEHLESNLNEMEELSDKLKDKQSQKRNIESKKDDISSSKDKHQIEDRIFKNLMAAQAANKLQGIYGKVGSLMRIDKYYNTAASVAGRGHLKKIVVGTYNQALKCIDYLRKNQIGNASFMILEKIEDCEKRLKVPFTIPEGTKRIFDLIDYKKPEIKNLCFFIFHNTLVAEDIETATKVAFGSDGRKRVVTVKGEIIERAGNFVGGGTPVKGLISSSNLDLTDQEDKLKKYEEQIEKLDREINQLKDKRNEYQANISRLRTDKDFSKKSEESMLVERKNLDNDIEELESKLEDNEKEMERIKKKIDEITNQSNLFQKVKKELDQLHKEKDKVKQRMEDLNNKLNAVGNEEYKQLKRQFKEHEELEKEIEIELGKNEAKYNSMMEQIERFKLKKKELTEELKELSIKNEEKLKKRADLEMISYTTQAKINDWKDKIKKKEIEISEKSKVLSVFTELLKKLKTDITTLEDEIYEKETLIKENKREQKATAVQIGALRSEYSKVSEGYACLDLLKEIEEFDNAEIITVSDSNSPSEKKKKSRVVKSSFNWERFLDTDIHQDYSEELIESMKDKISMIKDRIEFVTAEKREKNPNLSALNKFIRKYQEHKEKKLIYENLNKEIEDLKEFLDQKKDERKTKFLEGFIVISNKLRETYRILTNGGDAELEMLDSSDPFSEGILFSVRPPNKSWKQMSKLSGGEKTLSSLSLVFALHHYKPNPIYFMDEIDAALDYKNVGIVAKFTKEKTKDAQFIVISLRHNMYEQANQLIGIFKVDDGTTSVVFEKESFQNSFKDEVDLNFESQVTDRRNTETMTNPN